MNLEGLADEVLLEVFEYLGGVSTLRLFSHFNARFEGLLILHFRSEALDLQSSSKSDFDLICRENLPSIIEHIAVLRLSDDDDTPHQIDLLLFRGFALSRFLRLRAITISKVSSNELISELVGQCRRIPHLARLEFIQCRSNYHRETLRTILNHLWSMTTLTLCKLDWTILHADRVLIPTVRSQSIECLSIAAFRLNCSQLRRWFRCTPALRDLTVWIADSSVDRPFSSLMPSIASLNLRVTDSQSLLINLLEHLPNLVRLKIITEHLKITGAQWQQLIERHLPRLKRFQLQMHYHIDVSNHVEEEIDRILHSYRTSFWLLDHQWFVRCCWKPSDECNFLFLHTAPYPGDFFPLHSRVFGPHVKSTCPSMDCYSSYDRVRRLQYDDSPSLGYYLADLRFSRLTHLELELPFSDQLFSSVPRLDRLISLRVSNGSPVVKDLLLSQLQTFLSSSIVLQLEVLSIVIDDQTQIFDLVKRMPRLQALKIEHQPEQTTEIRPNRHEIIQFMVSGGSLDDLSTSRLWIR